MSRHPLRAALGALLIVLSLSAPASATDVNLHLGAGPRMHEGGLDAVGGLHGDVELATMLHLTLDLQAYLGGAQTVGFAGFDAGVLFVPPIPGPVGLQIGLLGTATSLDKARHGTDDWMIGVAAEAAVTATFGAFQARVAYTHVLASPTKGHTNYFRNQVMIGVGASF